MVTNTDSANHTKTSSTDYVAVITNTMFATTTSDYYLQSQFSKSFLYALSVRSS